MAKKVEIEVDVTGNVVESTKNLRALKAALRDVPAGTAEWNKIKNQIRDVEDALESAGQSSEDLKGLLEAAPGPLGALGRGIKSVELATKSWGAALKATGIGLIVSLVAGLAAAFAQSEEAGKKLEPLFQGLQKILQGVFRAIEPVFNILVDLAVKALPLVSEAFSVVYSALSSVLQGIGLLGRAVAKFITGDFAGAWQDAGDAVTGFGKRYDEAQKNFVSGTKELTAKEKEELAKRQEQEKAALEKRRQQQEEHRKKVAEDNKTADQKLLDAQNEFEVLSAKSQDEGNKIKLRQELAAEEKAINALLITEKRKGELIAQAKKLYNLKVQQIDDERRKQETKEREDANKELIKLAEDLTVELIKDEKKKAEELLKINFDRQKKTIEQSKASEEEKNKALLALDKKYLMDKEKIEEDARKKQLEKDAKTLDDQLKLLELRGQILNRNTQEYFRNQEEILTKAYEKEKLLAQGNAELLLQIEKKYQEDKKNLKRQEIAAYGEVAAATINSFAAITGALAAGYDEEAKTSKKAFEQRKKLQVATALMSAASGVIQILTQPSTLPSPFDWIVKTANALALGITTAIQIKNIKKTEFAGESGGSSSSASGASASNLGRNYADGGLVIGPGGPKSDSIPANLSNGEAVMTSGAVTMFAPLLSMMNQMGGGTSFSSGLNTTLPDNPNRNNPAMEQQPVIMKTYVVESELTSSQQKQARLKDLSTL